MSATLVAEGRSGERRFEMVCCHCQKVRTPSGEWEHPRRSVTDPASHGICRACLVRYYPEVTPPPEAP